MSRPAGDGGYDAQNGLTLAEGEATALVYNADLRLARLKAAEASASARNAGRWEDPVLGFDGEKILAGVSDPWILGGSLAVTLPFSGRLDAAKREACAEERAAIARVVAEEWAVRVRVRLAWLEWSYQGQRIDAARRLLDRLGALVTTAARLEEAGELSRLEARLFRAEQASRQLEVRSGESRARELDLEIKTLMGLIPSAPVRILAATEPGARPAAGVSQNPGLAALAAAYDVSEESLRLEITKQYPDLVTAPGGKTEDGDGRMTLGLDLPLPLWNQNRKAIAEARARRDTARAGYETAYEALVARAAAAEIALQDATTQRENLESSLVPLLEDQARDVQRVVDLGQVNTLVILDTLIRQHDANLKLIEVRLREARALVQLQELAGPARSQEENR